MDDTTQYREDLVLCLHPFFELNILVPERVSEEIKTDAVGTTLKEAVSGRLAWYTLLMLGGGVGWEDWRVGSRKK